ncbi:transposase [Actinosynnema sp. CS-041913]|uniref:transposase n=1 Tax=Actinosynnema sp. CS-041913 TaxID=3239917 RepID=UPI003D9501F0
MHYELLANYLAPTYGNIYQYNLGANGLVGLDVQQWTDDLKRAVRHYLMHELPADVKPRLLEQYPDLPTDSDEAALDALIEATEPWSLAFAVRKAAVAAVPTLDGLVGDVDDMRAMGELSENISFWLDRHASEAQLEELAELTGHPEIDLHVPSYKPRPEGYHFIYTKPRDVLDAWQQVAGSSVSDLTDQEWDLVVKALRLKRHVRSSVILRSYRELNAKRRTFNGVRYKVAHRCTWSQVPRRYGDSRTLYQSDRTYKMEGLYRELLEKLGEEAGAERVVAWLKDRTSARHASGASS